MNEEAMDMEMTEVEASSTSTLPPPTPPQMAAPLDDVVNLLALARQLVDQGQPSQALQAVVMAMRAKGGEQAVFYILQRARELYRSKLQTSSEADQLASLFAECVIAEAQPPATTEPTPTLIQSPSFPVSAAQTQTPPPTHPIDSESYEKSILAETGRKQIMLDAFSDGSSFICLQCGGLVSSHRKDEHYAYWCQF